jgi:hypothetical protein
MSICLLSADLIAEGRSDRRSVRCVGRRRPDCGRMDAMRVIRARLPPPGGPRRSGNDATGGVRQAAPTAEKSSEVGDFDPLFPLEGVSTRGGMTRSRQYIRGQRRRSSQLYGSDAALENACINSREFEGGWRVSDTAKPYRPNQRKITCALNETNTRKIVGFIFLKQNPAPGLRRRGV